MPLDTVMPRKEK